MAMSVLGLFGLIGGLIGLVFGRRGEANKNSKRNSELEAEVANLKEKFPTGPEARIAVAGMWRKGAVHVTENADHRFDRNHVCRILNEADDQERLACKPVLDYSTNAINEYINRAIHHDGS